MNVSGEPISSFEPQPPAVQAPQPEPASGYPPPTLWPYPLTVSQIIDRIFFVMLIVYAGMYVVILICVAILACLAAFAAFLFSILHLNLTTPWSFLELILLVPVWLAMMLLWTALPMAAAITALAVIYRDQRLRIDGVTLHAAL